MTISESQPSGSPTLVHSKWGAIVIIITVALQAILAFLPANLLSIAIAGVLFALALLMRDPM